MKALAVLVAALIALVFLYGAGRMFGAGLFRSWREATTNKKKEEE